MEDILLLQFLRKKGIISDKDIHEFHELASINITGESIPSVKSINTDNDHISESKAKELVSNMYHIESGRKYIGEKFDIYKAKEIRERYRGLLSSSVTTCDVYIAINYQYHNYIILFKSWFNDNIDQKIIESAIVYWFEDDDYIDKYKLLRHMNEQ